MIISKKSAFCSALLFFLSILTMAGHAQEKTHRSEAAINQKVDSVMKQMNLTDKIGEMTQLAIGMISKDGTQKQQIDGKKLRKILLDYRVGSILNVGDHAYTRDHWHDIIRKIQDVAVNDKPTHIPVLYGIDSIHGANYVMGSTLFPQQIAMAATWNPDLVKQGARISAYETRSAWIPWAFSPVLGIGRDPRWSRFWETFGEDITLTKTMGRAMVEGFQSRDVSDPYRVTATAKHYLGYSLPASGHDRTNAWIPERRLREQILPSFKAAINAGAHTVMINSGAINEIPVHSSKKILTGLLRHELGFKGIAVSDWQDIIKLYKYYHITDNYKESIKVAINAGVDMSMVPSDTKFPRLLKQLVQEGKVPMSRINESVHRILRVKFLLGLFEHPYPKNTNYSKFASDEFAHASYQSATEAITLLKNDNNILPLSKDQHVFVAGPAANKLTYLNGGWSRTWQGANPAYNTPAKKTILEAIKDKIGGDQVDFVEGSSIDKSQHISDAVQAARQADAAVICVGESTYTETPGDIADLTLPKAQRKLVNKISATGTPVMMVMVEGRPRIVSDIVPDADGVLMDYLPGQEGGRATADILFGDVNPSGKLPFTYPRHVNDLVPYDHSYAAEGEPLGFHPQWQFGYGLSYTTFNYANLNVDKTSFSGDQSVNISVDVTNAGDRAGKETVQLYVSDLVASVAPPVKKLRAFDKISLTPGETKTVSFSLSADVLSFIGRNNNPITEPGDFTIQVDSLSKTITYQK